MKCDPEFNSRLYGPEFLLFTRLSMHPSHHAPGPGRVSHLLTELAILLKLKASVAVTAEDDGIVELCLVLRDWVVTLPWRDLPP